MVKLKKIILLPLILVSVTLLSACGGGGSSTDGVAENVLDSMDDGTAIGGGDTSDGDGSDAINGDTTDADDENVADAGEEDSLSGSAGDTDGDESGLVAGADATVIFAVGGPVPNLVDATFTNLNAAAISPAGDACVSAGYNQNQESLQGVWCGPPESPQLILQSDDTVVNLPSNILFESAADLFFADNGSLLMSVSVSGASNGGALLVWDGQTIQSILRTGELAPGFTDGSVVGSIEVSSFSNAGAVIHGTAGSTIGMPVLWNWDGANVSLITRFSAFGEIFPADQNNCQISVTFPNPVSAIPRINNNGVIAFFGLLSAGEQTQDAELCSGFAIVQKTGDTFTTVVRNGDTVPSTETAEFQSVTLNELFDSGAMSISSALDDDNASGLSTGRLSTWIFLPDGTANLVTIVEETVPPGFVDRISLVGNLPIVVASGENTSVQLTQTSLGVSLLTGAPHSGNPYPDIGAVGATNMSLVASTNSDSPEGFADNSFLSSFSRPGIDQNGRIFYRATIEVPSENISANAFYTAVADQPSTLVFGSGSLVDYDGEARLVTNITFPDAETLSLFIFNSPGVLVSQQGDALVPVTLEGFGDALLHLSL